MSKPQPQSILYDMTSTAITIRPAYADDQLALRRLADLDSAPAVPEHPLLVAEAEGQLRVALSVHDGSVIADPFFPTAGIVGLLRDHARADKPRRSMRRSLRSARRALRPPRTAPAWTR